jgi:putative ABC transport system ATP-binding protein
LDGETGRDILGLFKELNCEGQTIIMVTHNPEVAHLARKTIFLRDGRLVNQV